jgi:hypothetical protein
MKPRVEYTFILMYFSSYHTDSHFVACTLNVLITHYSVYCSWDINDYTQEKQILCISEDTG